MKNFFLIKYAIYSSRHPKLQEKPSALKREHPAPQKFINCFLFFLSFLPSWIRIHNTAKYVEFEENFQVFMMYLVKYKFITVATNVVFSMT